MLVLIWALGVRLGRLRVVVSNLGGGVEGVSWEEGEEEWCSWRNLGNETMIGLEEEVMVVVVVVGVKK